LTDDDDDDEGKEEDAVFAESANKSNSSLGKVFDDDGANAVRFGDERAEFDAPADLRFAT
jgi:hypothetical protein